MPEQVIPWKATKEAPVPSLGIRILLGIYRLLGWRAARFSTGFVLTVSYPFYFAARKASAVYRRNWSEFTGKRYPGSGWSHMLSFAFAMLDRLACWGGMFPKESVRVRTPEGVEQLTDDCRNGKGTFCLVSHMGNAELLRALITPLVESFGRHIHVYLDIRLSRRFCEIVERVNGKSGLFLHSIDELGVGSSIEMVDYLNHGDIIIMAGDRSSNQNPRANKRRNFLGKTATFPMGTFRLAASLGCPVYSLFLLDVHGRYDLFTHRVSTGDVPATGLLDAYVDRIEALCLTYPDNWHNFYPYWT